MEEKPLRKFNHHTLLVIKGLCGSHGWATAYANLGKCLLNKKIKQKGSRQCLLCLTEPDCYRKPDLAFRSIQVDYCVCVEQTDLCMPRLTEGFKPQGKKKTVFFDYRL